MKTLSKKINIVCLFVLILSLSLDQITKIIAQQKLPDSPIDIIKGVFSFTYLENRGVGFGLLQNKVSFILIVNIIVLCIIAFFYVKLPKERRFFPIHILCSLIVSGALGNIIDRVRLGYVIDFFYFELINFPIFNVADIFVTVSVFLLIILIFFVYKDEDFESVFKKKKNNNDITNEVEDE